MPQERAQASGQPNLLAADPIRLLQSGRPQLPEQGSISAATSSLSGACGSHNCCDQGGCLRRPSGSADLRCSPTAFSTPSCPLTDMALGSRQARLDRYREKKRTRGFSSKIRYEMRKINAERRPRVKVRRPWLPRRSRDADHRLSETQSLGLCRVDLSSGKT